MWCQLLLHDGAWPLEDQEPTVTLDLQVVQEVQTTREVIVHEGVFFVKLRKAFVNTVLKLLEVMHEVHYVLCLGDDVVYFNFLFFEGGKGGFYGDTVFIEVGGDFE